MVYKLVCTHSTYITLNQVYIIVSVSLWRRANARNVRLYYPYWQYTDHFIFRFIHNCDGFTRHLSFVGWSVRACHRGNWTEGYSFDTRVGSTWVWQALRVYMWTLISTSNISSEHSSQVLTHLHVWCVKNPYNIRFKLCFHTSDTSTRN